MALDQETLKPVFIPADERYKEAVAFFHKLYAEGIMDPEFITQDGSMADAKMKNEEVSLVGTGITWEVTSGLAASGRIRSDAAAGRSERRPLYPRQRRDDHVFGQ